MSQFICTYQPKNKTIISISDYLKSLNYSEKKIKQTFIRKECFINNEIVDCNYLLKKDDIIMINLNDETLDFEPEYGQLNVLYEDDYLLIVDKIQGRIIYYDDKSKKGTMNNLVSGYYHKKGIEYRIRHIHRLDTDTSGCLLYAKDPITQASLDKMLEKKEIKREYLALCEGKFNIKQDQVKTYIGKNRHVNNMMVVTKKGISAITNYQVIKEYSNYSLVKLILETGRMHQIRVHMQYLKHSLCGDYLYGAKLTHFPRVLLHSSKISFIHPITNKTICIEAPIPKDFNQYMK